MPSSLKPCIKPHLDHLLCQTFFSRPASDNQDIRIVVLPGHPCSEGVPDKGSPYLRELVGNYGHPNPSPAYQDAPFKLSVRYPHGECHPEIRVINRLAISNPQVGTAYTRIFQEGPELLLKFKNALVAGNSNVHR